MKAAPITNKPDFSLMKQSDILQFYHIQIPRWLFFDSRYIAISLEAKMVYGFLLNRFQLSKLNGWINDDGEVFLIYTREDLSGELGISYRKAISCMKELKSVNLIWERRCGRGDANQIYLARVTQNEEEALKHRSAPFAAPEDEAAGSRSAELVYQDGEQSEPEYDLGEESEGSRPAGNVPLSSGDVPNTHIKGCGNGTSTTADSASPDVQKRQPSYNNKNYINSSDTDKSQSVYGVRTHESTSAVDTMADDTQELDRIIESCELWIFPPDTAKVFENAIERLWFSNSFRIGKAELPQKKVRSRLCELDNIKLQEAMRKISANTKHSIRDSTAYIMAVIFNCITESDSDMMVDPYLNGLRQGSDSGGDS